jgi:CRP/FNR family cyclic AMP-dependent transcriptional regulator
MLRYTGSTQTLPTRKLMGSEESWGPKDLLSVMGKAWPHQFSERAAELLLTRGRVVKYKPGTVIASQGTASKGLHIVLDGLAEVTSLRPSGKEMVINIMGPGQAYSFLHIYHPDPHSSSLVARTLCQVLTVAKQDWLLTTEECPEIKDAVIAILSARLRAVLEELTFSSLNSGLGRLAHRLLNHVLQNFIQDAGGRPRNEYDVALTQSHLAAMISFSRQRTHALLHQLEQRKAVRLNYGRITVIDLDALRQVITDSEAE